jgi:HK97 family phage major capsid protein
MKIRRQRERMAETKERLDELLTGVAERDGRMTTDERSQADQLTKTMREQGTELDRLLEEEKRNLSEASARDGNPASPEMIEVTTPEGRTRVPLLRPEDRLARRSYNLPGGVRAQDLDLARYLRGCLIGDWRGADAERRVWQAGVGGTGGFLLPEPLSDQVLDVARNLSVVVRAGARTIAMQWETLRVARQLSDATAVWRPESKELTESEPAMDEVKFEATTLGAVIRISRVLLENGSNAGAIATRAIAAGIATELDRAALFGHGTEEPLGVFDTPGISGVNLGVNGAALADYSAFSRAVQAIREQNLEPDGVVYSPRTSGELDRLVSTLDGQPLREPRSYSELRKLASNQVPNALTHGTATDASAAIVGAWSNLWIALQRDLRIDYFSGSDSTVRKLETLVLGFIRADSLVVRPAGFCVITGITPGT